MYVLIEINKDGSYDDASLVMASGNISELQVRMIHRYEEALHGAFSWLLPLTEDDLEICTISPRYACIGAEGSGELIEWYIFDASDKNTWHTTC